MPFDTARHDGRRASARRRVSLDYETFSETQLVGPASVGAWSYSRDLSTEVLMVAYKFDDGPYISVDLTEDPFPEELREALLDPECEKWAFNAAFERLITLNTLNIATPYRGWRCTMALANLQSFTGDLGTVGRAMGLPEDKVKDKEGGRLIKLFCGAQKLSRKNSEFRRTSRTDPDDWQAFLQYNLQDVVAETEIRDKLLRFEIPTEEWETYELDQKVNDEGLPVNRQFVVQADIMSNIRKRELTARMVKRTDLSNPNSTAQLLPWLQARGYPFADLQKATISKVLTSHKTVPMLGDEAVAVLKLRQQASRTSVKKYPAILRRLSPDDRLRHSFQFAGAARTARWSGRGPQPQNLTKTPAILEADDGDATMLEACASIIESGRYGDLELFIREPMTAIAGSIRSSFQAPDGYDLVVCDLSAIESAVIAWLSGCERMLNVFRDKRDPYKDFGIELFRKPYDAIIKSERTICKPAVLGCGYQLGGGMLKGGKRTGLWGYAEAMGVELTREEAVRQVGLFREVYHEIPQFWRALETAGQLALRDRLTTVGGKLAFAMDGPYMTVRLPSGRKMYYYKPRMVNREFERADGSTYTRRVLSYMGMNQVTHQWGRVFTSGGKQAENVVQATARDILAIGMRRAAEVGFTILGSVHDEIITLVRRGDNRLTLGLLRECMIDTIWWAIGLPLGANGYIARVYRKD